MGYVDDYKMGHLDKCDIMDIIEAGDIDTISEMIENGYTTCNSFSCDWNTDNDLYTAFENDNKEMFTLLLKATKVENLSESEIARFCVPNGVPYMEILRQRLPIKADHIVRYMESKWFNKRGYNRLVKFISQKEDIYFEKMNLTSKNYKVYKDNLLNGRINVDGAFSSILAQILQSIHKVKDCEILEIAKLCIEMDADISKIIRVSNNNWFKKGLELFPGLNIKTKFRDVSLSLETMKYIVENVPFESLSFDDQDWLKIKIRFKVFEEIISYKKKDYIIHIQRCFRDYQSKL